uniref:Uncharacterized protein n=1 Tax=Paramormyrops kingsleyae TaxID=1676925 RepID=A0A3B3SWR2_9TELE
LLCFSLSYHLCSLRCSVPEPVCATDLLRGRSLEQQLYSAVCSASSWTDDVESSLFSGHVLLAEGAEAQLCNQEALGKDVREVEEEVGRSRKLVADSAGLCKEAQAPMEEALDYLHVRLETLDSVLEQRCEETRRRLQELSSFQVGLVHACLSQSFADTASPPCFPVTPPLRESDVPLPPQTIAEAEESVRELEQRMVELKSRGEVLQPDQVCTQELLKLQDAHEELVHLVGSRRSGLNQNLALKVQCEQALQDLVDLLDTAQDKMAADQKMIASSVDEVQNVLDKHKEFFQGLESHMILTETLFRRIGGFVLPRENQALEETLAQAQGVLKQAHKRGVELEYVLESWTLLEEQYQALLTQLEAVEASIPTVGLVEETEERLAERIALYQRLKAGLAQRQPQLYQALEDGKRLLLTVSCSGLEAQLTQLAEHWLSCSTRVNKELHRCPGHPFLNLSELPLESVIIKNHNGF